MPSPAAIRQHGLFLFILAFAAALRLGPLARYQFTYDEISALQRVGFGTIAELIERGVKIDAHPALLQVIIFLVTKWAGFGTWYIKLPFILVSICGLLYAYTFCNRNFSLQAARVAAVIFAFSLPFVYYAPIARMYGPGVFLCLGLLFHFYEIVFNKNASTLHLCLFSAFLLTGALNHHMNALYCASVYLSGWFFIPGPARVRYLTAGCAAVLLYLPHIPVTLYQLSVGGIGVDQGGWLEAPSWVVLPELLNVIFGAGYGLFVMLVVLLVAWRAGLTSHAQAKRWLPAALFLFNFAVVFLYSISRFPVYQHSVMLFASAGLVLWFSTFADTKNSRLNHTLTGVLLFWFCWQTYIEKDYFRQSVKTVYQYQFEQTAKYSSGNPGVYGIFFDTDSVMHTLFMPETGNRFPHSLEGSPVQRSLADFIRFIDTTQANMITLGSSSPIHQAIVRDRFPFLIENTQTQGIHYKVYSTDRKQRPDTVRDDSVIVMGTSAKSGLFTYPDRKGHPLDVPAADEFPFIVQVNYDDAVSDEGNVVLAEARIYTDTRLNDVQCVMSVTSGKKTLHYTAGISADQQLETGGEFILRAELFAGNFHRQTNDSTMINIYMWNRSRQPFKLLGLTVKTIDHWPQKWQFWK